MIASNFGVVQLAHNIDTIRNSKAMLNAIIGLYSLLWIQNINYQCWILNSK